jgi:GT2 family glycosyltransferase
VVAIIILNWNGFEDTRECLESLRQMHDRDYRVVLVDNASDNSEGARLKSLFPEVHLIQNDRNRGFAGGNNDGIRWALQQGYDYIINLNNDCIVEQKWLGRLVKGLQASGADFASSLIAYYPETHLVCSDENMLLPDGSGLVINHCKPVEPARGIRPVFSASGAASLYSAACLEGVKLRDDQFFDELYFAYLEDLDLGIRLNSKGFKGVCIPDAVVYHKESQASGYRSGFHIFHIEKNRVLNELLNYPLWLIPLGELFYCIKTIANFFLKKAKKPRDAGQAKKYNPLSVIIDSRMWVLRNISAILHDRQDRKTRGLINGKIYKFFFWNMRIC